MENNLLSRTEDFSGDLWRLTPAHLAQRLTRGSFVRYPHIEFISQKIAQSIICGNSRIILSMPPRHGKSLLTSVWTPVWFLSLSPECNVILTGYEADFAAQWGRQVRNIISEHGPELRLSLTEDSKAANRWNTPQGGGMITAGIGGPITGRGGHLIIIDDPIKNFEEAASETIRRKQIEWFHSTLYTRCEPGASIIVLMTRWHQEDLAGYLLSQVDGGWEEIRFPALAEESDPIGRQPGQALCPERYDENALESIKKNIGTRMFASLFQQRPSAEEGNIFKREWFQFCKEFPKVFENKIMSCDLSFKDTKTSDFVVLQIWGRVGPNKYLIDQVRARMDFPTTVRAVRDLVAKHRPFAILVEDKANGPALIDTLKKEISGIIAIKPDGSKEARASAVSAQFESRNIFFPDPSIAPWVEDLLEECVNFPNATHDDQVDAMTQALKRLEGRVMPFAPRIGRSIGWPERSLGQMPRRYTGF